MLLKHNQTIKEENHKITSIASESHNPPKQLNLNKKIIKGEKRK